MMRSMRLAARMIGAIVGVCAGLMLLVVPAAAAWQATLPDGRTISPDGFTTPVEGFASSEALSPDGKLLAVLSQQGGAVDIILTGEDSKIVNRLSTPWATSMTWTTDGLYVTRGYTGSISRFTYNPDAQEYWMLHEGIGLHVGGLLNGIAEDPATHRLLVARTASQEVDEIDDATGTVTARFAASGQPFAVGFVGNTILATLYNADHIDAWPQGATEPTQVPTGPHPTQLLIAGQNAYVANADGHDVCLVDGQTLKVTRRFELGTSLRPPFGQTPSGMALSHDGKRLFVAESGYNDVAVVDAISGRVLSRIPSGWYPMGVIAVSAATIDKDPRTKEQLYILSAQGLGTQPDPGSEWDGTYTGLVQHLVVEPSRFAAWSATVAKNDRFTAPASPASALPAVKHFIFIVRENKHFDEEFGDEPRANADPDLLLYGRKYTPNAHALADRYVLFDNFMGNGEASIYGHSWTTQGIANDYLERNAHTPDDPAAVSDPRVASSIWPYPLMGEDTVSIATMDFDWFRDLSTLPAQPRVNVSAVFGPRGELIDELRRKGVSFRVYGEQMTMLSDGRIAPGLAAHADRDYPGAHIDFDVLDTERARLFLADVRAHGLAQYSYLTLPTDHTAGNKKGFYTPASYVASNDVALGQIIEGLSSRPEWSQTVVFVTTDDPQGTGDHVDSHRMPALLIGPHARRGLVDHTRYSLPSVLRTVEVLFGLDPLDIYDAGATPMLDALGAQAQTARYTALPSLIPMEKNAGKAQSAALVPDGPWSASLPDEEWLSIRGPASLAQHHAYLMGLGKDRTVAADADGD